MRRATQYPHDDPDGIVPQQYPPDELVGVDYYRPTTHGAEREIAGRLDKLRAIIRRAADFEATSPGIRRRVRLRQPALTRCEINLDCNQLLINREVDN